MSAPLRKQWDDNPFEEQYVQDVKVKDIVTTICNLDKHGLNMVKYLYIDPCIYRDMFVIVSSDFCKTMKLKSTKSYYLSIDNLIKNGLLAKSTEVNFYYFNPHFFKDQVVCH